MRPSVPWLVLVAFAIGLAVGALLLEGTGFTGHTWYSRPTTILPAVAGAILGMRLEIAQWKALFPSRVMTLLLTWGIATLVIVAASMLFASLYDIVLDGPQLLSFVRMALYIFVIGAAAAIIALALITVVRSVLIRSRLTRA